MKCFKYCDEFLCFTALFMLPVSVIWGQSAPPAKPCYHVVQRASQCVDGHVEVETDTWDQGDLSPYSLGSVTEGQITYHAAGCLGGSEVTTTVSQNFEGLGGATVCCEGTAVEAPSWKVFSIDVAKEKPFWQKVMVASDMVKNTIKKVPWEIVLEGPAFTGTYKARDCCKKDEENIVEGEKDLSASLSLALKGENIPCFAPPWTASFFKEYTKYGCIWEMKFNWGLLLSVAAELKGDVSYASTECEDKDCLNMSVALRTPISLGVKGTIEACIKKTSSSRCLGQTAESGRCNNSTLYQCGYCYLHLGQSAYCTVTCPSVSINIVNISTHYSISAEYKCTGDWKYDMTIGAVFIRWPGVSFGPCKFEFQPTVIQGMSF